MRGPGECKFAGEVGWGGSGRQAARWRAGGAHNRQRTSARRRSVASVGLCTPWVVLYSARLRKAAGASCVEHKASRWDARQRNRAVAIGNPSLHLFPACSIGAQSLLCVINARMAKFQLRKVFCEVSVGSSARRQGAA